MSDLTAFVHAQLDDDERVAKAAPPGPWSTPGPDTVGQWLIYDSGWTVASATAYDHDERLSSKPETRGPGYIDPDATAEHIARWDPARVLARIKADRLILAEHREVEADDVPGLVQCAFDGEVMPCRHVRLIGTQYADKPGYREEWADVR